MGSSNLDDFIAWFVLIVLFSAYTRNMQTTTMNVGKSLFNSEEGPGVQDAITPRWQTRNNILMFIGFAIYLVVCFYVFDWYWSLAVFFATFFIAIPLASRLIVPRPMSNHFLKKIETDLLKRRKEFLAVGDELRAGAVDELLAQYALWNEKNQP